MNSERNLRAYHFSFKATGNDLIDAILEAVARSGKRYHHTSDWRDDELGESCESAIQRAANDAASALSVRKLP